MCRRVEGSQEFVVAFRQYLGSVVGRMLGLALIRPLYRIGVYGMKRVLFIDEDNLIVKELDNEKLG